MGVLFQKRSRKIHLVTFSDSSMGRSRVLCHASARAHGVDDTGQDGAWTPERLASWCEQSADWYGDEREKAAKELGRRLRDAMEQPSRGIAFWAWKPFVILEALEFGWPSNQDDIVIYADAGIEFVDNINHIIGRMDQDIFLFGNQWEHAHWCKRDIVEAIWPLQNDNGSIGATLGATSKAHIEWARFGKQVQASVIFFRVNDKTRSFVKEWLDWCLFEGGRLIDDSPSRTPNHPEFQENRHDQAILTTMAYRDGYELHWWPAMYNDGAFIYERGDYPDEGYPVLVHHHRRRNHEWAKCA